MKKIFILFLFISLTAKSQILKIKGAVFDMDTYVLMTKDTSMALKFINNIYPDITYKDLDCRGVTFYEYGKPIMMWIESTPITIEQFAVLNHEILHIVVSILKWAGVPLSDDTEEVYAYMMHYYTLIIYKYFKLTK